MSRAINVNINMNVNVVNFKGAIFVSNSVIMGSI